MTFTDLLAGTDTGSSATTVYEIPETWMQGRTAYGGLTAALCAEEARRRFDGLPPLRTAQVAFVGPATEQLVAEATLIRQGKSTAFVEVTLRGEKGIATRGMFVYGAPRPSEVRFLDLAAPSVAKPADLEVLPSAPPLPAFLRNFDLAVAAGNIPYTGSDEAVVTWWGRHHDPAARSTAIGLLALGDLLPPAASPRMSTFAPVSSVNWHVDFLSDDLSSQDGWFLMDSRAESAGDGWSAQQMAMWSHDGRPVMAGRQSIVVFS
ncbi:MAG: thioesterase family protein [Pseudomonadota bacterium]